LTGHFSFRDPRNSDYNEQPEYSSLHTFLKINYKDKQFLKKIGSSILEPEKTK
jgi:hypothetical protein